MVTGCAVRQGNILRVAAKLVRPGGYLLYSTCTFAPEENEGVIAQFLDHHPDFEVVTLPRLPGFMPGKPEWVGEKNKKQKTKEALAGAVRLFPHRVAGEGHFICLLKRGGEVERQRGWEGMLPGMNRLQAGLWQDFGREVLAVDLPADRLRVRGERLYLIPEGMPDFGNPSTSSGRGLRLVHPGVWFGNFKKDRFEPAHPLALYLRRGEAKRTIDLHANGREVAAYLRGETLPSNGPPGWTLVTVDGWPLGWGKRVQGIVKNHYPRGWM
jgi:NOL1/NOP2/fmu family ribosome biogenesis protein